MAIISGFYVINFFIVHLGCNFPEASCTQDAISVLKQIVLQQINLKIWGWKPPPLQARLTTWHLPSQLSKRTAMKVW